MREEKDERRRHEELKERKEGDRRDEESHSPQRIFDFI